MVIKIILFFIRFKKETIYHDFFLCQLKSHDYLMTLNTQCIQNIQIEKEVNHNQRACV